MNCGNPFYPHLSRLGKNSATGNLTWLNDYYFISPARPRHKKPKTPITEPLRQERVPPQASLFSIDAESAIFGLIRWQHGRSIVRPYR